MNDFACIRQGGHRFRPEDSVELHEASRTWLAGQLEQTFDGRTVVVTHHLPASTSIAMRYVNCPATPAGANVDQNGCAQNQLDDDSDGVTNDVDVCPATPAGATVDGNGCAQSQLDDDNDGVTNNMDVCPATPAGATVDGNGCAQSQLDDDNDGITNNMDVCPATPAAAAVDGNGCAQSQLDDDNDGVTNDKDACPNTAAGQTVNADGCVPSPPDNGGSKGGGGSQGLILSLMLLMTLVGRLLTRSRELRTYNPAKRRSMTCRIANPGCPPAHD